MQQERGTPGQRCMLGVVQCSGERRGAAGTEKGIPSLSSTDSSHLVRLLEIRCGCVSGDVEIGEARRSGLLAVGTNRHFSLGSNGSLIQTSANIRPPLAYASPEMVF